jgi:hypothetical protein
VPGNDAVQVHSNLMDALLASVHNLEINDYTLSDGNLSNGKYYDCGTISIGSQNLLSE